MRPRIEALDVDALEWQPLGPPGLYSKLLSRDTETGARTALQRLCMADHYEPPKTAHFHTTYEEILGVSGLFSFDSRLWVRPGSYVFHPPRTVHGFKSAIKQESTFLSRVGRDLDFNLVHEPNHDDLYVAEGDAPPRQPVAYDDAVARVGKRSGTLLGDSAEVTLLSQDPVTGEGSALIAVGEAWRGAETRLATYLELFVVEGGIGIGVAPETARRDYFFYPPGETIPALAARASTTLYVNFGADIGL